MPNRYIHIQAGQRFTKNGVSVDVTSIARGEVYVRVWPKGVRTQPFYAHCYRVPVAMFIEQIRSAKMEATGA
jgi:hypothetical protein